MANILVIDDDADIQRLLQFALKRAGHTVSISSDGEQGLLQAETDSPDLIVCDIMMPKMTGYEFCRQARTKPGLKETPIIVFSARFQPVDRQTALEAGATEYLSKSTAPDELVNRITELIPVTTTKTSTTQGMVALFSLRGGVGVTALSVNLAIALALSKKTKTALIDMALVGGHAALMLGVRPTSSISNLLASVNGDFTADAIAPHFIQHGSGVQLLASDPAYGKNFSLSDDRLLKLVPGLKSAYPLNVLDVPHILEPHFSPVLKPLDKVILVLSADMPSVQSTAIALQGLVKMGMDVGKINLVVNQVAQYNILPTETIQKALKRPISATIPFDPGMTKAVNSGKPLLLSNPQSNTSKSIAILANKIFT